jgi:tRNA(Ile)-lysidine synthase
MHLITKVKKNIQGTEFFGYRGTVIIGVSGGSDSMALTHLLHALQFELGFHLHIAHFNHNLRRSAKADQKFVEEVAEELNVPCSVGYWDNPKALKKGSLEEAARTERFKFFRRLARKINAKVVVLAHTEDDLAETVMMRILRGTGLQGLRGILPRRELEDIWVIRPLLNVKKSAILAYLKKKRIPFRADPTNRQKKFFRNKVRLELLPLLARKYNRNIKEILINLAKNAGTDYDYLETQAQKVFLRHARCPAHRKSVSVDLTIFSQQHAAIKNMIVRLGVQWMKGDTNRLTSAHFREIESLLNDRPKGALVHLPQGICIQKNIQYLVLSRTQPFHKDSSKIFV